MDTRTGDIYEYPYHATKKIRDRLVPVSGKTLTQAQRFELAKSGVVRIGRNEPCPCGSGQKFKRCCFRG